MADSPLYSKSEEEKSVQVSVASVEAKDAEAQSTASKAKGRSLRARLANIPVSIRRRSTQWKLLRRSILFCFIFASVVVLYDFIPSPNNGFGGLILVGYGA